MSETTTTDAGAVRFIQGIEIDKKVQAVIIKVCVDYSEVFEELDD